MRNLILIFSAAFLLFSCNLKTQKGDMGSKNVITVSILPERTFVKKIAGDDFEVNVLIPPGASPAAYTLLPSQLKEIANSVVWFRMGHIAFEYSWREKIEQANREMKVVDLSEGLDLIAENNEQHGDHVHMNGINPHTWMSPVLVKQMAKRIADELTILNPEKGPEYKVNYLKFVKEIDQLNVKIKNILKNYEGKKIILFHPSLTYFARDYGLIEYSLESGGKEPTPQHLTEVVDLAKEEGIKKIYIQSEFDREHARVFAEEIRGEIIQIRPLDPAWSENLMEITQILADNF